MLDPVFVSIDEAAAMTSESQWTVKQKLRAGIYRAKKSGRRTLILVASILEHASNLPDAVFAPPSRAAVSAPPKPRRHYRRRSSAPNSNPSQRLRAER